MRINWNKNIIGIAGLCKHKKWKEILENRLQSGFDIDQLRVVRVSLSERVVML